MQKTFSFILVSVFILVITPSVFARTTPEDILNEQKAVYNQRVASYSPQSQLKLDQISKKISDLNKRITQDYVANMFRQGYILEEYIRRNEIADKKQTDGKTRDLSQPIENARYWLTYAHEAVAYQAAKVYIFNLTSEKNINSDILNQINSLQADTNILKGKVIKSQQIISQLVNQ